MGNNFPIIQAMQIVKEDDVSKKLFKFGTFRRRFRVIEDYLCWCKYLNRFILIPKGFVFDGASIPKIINSIFSPTGVLFYGALPHDFGYKYGGLLLIDKTVHKVLEFHHFSKSDLDEIFQELCAQESGMKVGSAVATFALKMFGFFAWKEHRKIDSNLSEDYPSIFV